MTTDAISRRSGRINPAWLLLVAIGVAILALIGLLSRLGSPNAGDSRPLRLYAAASVRVPLERIVAEYAAECGVAVEIQYGGSHTLLNQLQVNQSADADLFLAADEFYTETAVELGLAADVLPIADTLPVLAVPVGNPRGIQSLDDLLQPGVRVACADPEQAAIGKAIRERLRQRPAGDGTFWDALQRQIVATGVFKPTVNDVANDLKLGAVDAGFVWDSTLAMPDYRQSLASVPTPDLGAEPDVLSIAVMTRSTQRAAALRFVRFITARDRGLVIFREFGVRPVEGSAWTDEDVAAIVRTGNAAP